MDDQHGFQHRHPDRRRDGLGSPRALQQLVGALRGQPRARRDGPAAVAGAGENFTPQTITELDALRARIRDAIGLPLEQAWLGILFTADPNWS
jgi:hypothetical protein